MKITVIGGGSTYTPELINGFLTRIDTFPLTELCLMDIDSERLDIVGGFAQRIAAANGNPFQVTLTENQRAAVDGASYVITQLRVGMMEARRADEYLGKRHNLVGQETTGIGGMAKALRTIPVIMQIAADIQSLSPDALLVNFTNPSGLVTQALSDYAPQVNTVGVCNVALHTKMEFIEGLEKAVGRTIDPAHAELDTLGLNHLTWHRGFKIDGEEMWPLILQQYLEELHADPRADFDTRTVETLQMIPNYYLHYFYYTQLVLEEQQHWPPSRAEQVMEIEADLLKEYADPNLTAPPADLMKRGGAYYSTVAAQLLNAHYNDLGETHVVNTAHHGAVPGWPENWVLEMPCQVDKKGIHPLPAQPLPPVCFGLLAQVKTYELLTARAAVSGDYRAAYQALLANPLGPPADQIEAVLDDLIETNQHYLPLFRSRN